MKELYYDSETIYTIYVDEKSQKYFIEVTCGTVGWYEVTFELNAGEIEAFKKDPKNLRGLRQEIFNNPEKFKEKRESIK